MKLNPRILIVISKRMLLATVVVAICACSKEPESVMVPLAPSNLTATPTLATQIDLSWSDNSTNEIGFRLERKTGTSIYADLSTVGANTTTFTDSDLAPGTTYTYRVYAYNSEGSSLAYSNEATAITATQPPSEITSFSPSAGSVGTTVIITGINFDTNPVKNLVVFNGAQVLAISSTSTNITVMVPNGAISGKIAVKVNGIAGTPSVSSFSIMSASILVSTLAGSIQGYADGQGAMAQFNLPYGISVGEDGSLYVADTDNSRICKVTLNGNVTTIAGNGTQGHADGIGTSATFYHPTDLAVDTNGNIFVADTDNNRIRKITPSGDVSTLAGNLTEGYADGIGTSAQFRRPRGIAVAANGDVYVADSENHRIRKITPTGTVTTLAGNSQGFADGQGSNALLAWPTGVAVDQDGIVYVADAQNHKIRKITAGGSVTTLAGNGTVGYADGEGTLAQFNTPYRVSIANTGNVYITNADATTEGISNIRKISPSGFVTTLVGGLNGYTDGTGVSAQFLLPKGISIGLNGRVYVADTYNNRIREITIQ